MGAGCGKTASGVTVTFRPAEDRDLDSIVAIERASFSDPWPRGGFEPLVRAPLCMFMVAEEANGIAGYSVTRWVEDEAELLNIAVAEDQRGNGIGGKMLDEVMSALEERGIRHIFLEVRDSNVAARELYRSRGFRELSRRTGYYQRPKEDAIVLAWRRGA